jgi:two-component system, chemotaxis family, CheB/CheR fusion protein
MTRRKPERAGRANLRARAEANVQSSRAEVEGLAPEALKRLTYELQVHQVELDLQNEELRASQEELARSRQEYRELYELAPVGYLTLDPAGTIERANRRAAELLGVADGELEGRRLVDFVRAEDQDALYRHRRAMTQGERPAECEIRLASDRRRWLVVQSARGGEPEHATWRAVLVDVSERKHSEEALREALHGLRDVLDTVPQPLVVLNRDLRVTTASASYYGLFGERPEDTEGRPFLAIADRRFDREPLRALLPDALASGRAVDEIELEVETSKLGARSLLLALHPTGRTLGPDGALLVSLEDVTDRRLAEEARIRSRAAEEVSLARSRFLAAASHDLRQPLQAAVLYARVLRESVADGDAEVLDKLGHCLHALGAMLTTLFDLSKLDHGGTRPDWRPVVASGVFATLEHGLRPRMAEQGVDFRVVRSSLRLWTDADLLTRLLQNLLVNAATYAAGGRVLLGCRRAGDAARIQVWDDGIGIAHDQLDSIFEEYYQVDNPARDRRQGLGLGLAIVKRISDLLEHPIAVHSEPGRGTLFEVRVPLAGQREEPRVEPAGGRRAGGSGALVVVIEDDQEVLDSLRRLLGLEGCEVAAGSDRQQVRAQLRGCAPDLILSDYRLGGGENGLEVIARLREELGAGIPAALLTGDTSDPDLADRTRRRDIVLLYKPLAADDLLALLRG